MTFRKLVAWSRGTPVASTWRTTASASGLTLEGFGEREHPVVLDSVDDDLRDLRLALGQGAGLVEDDGVDAGGGLDRGRVLEQDPAPGAQRGPHHDGGRCGQTEGIGTGDHDDGDGEQQRGLHACPCREPDQEGAGAAAQRDEHQPERRPVGQPLSGSLGVLRLLDERDDLGQRGVCAHLGGPHP
nr:hypothetical protein [Cumulibacter manganitolerans]